MSIGRKFRRRDGREIDMRKVQSNAPSDYGCDGCRDVEGRRAFVSHLLMHGLGTHETQCQACGAAWTISLFAVGPNQEIHAQFAPNRGQNNGSSN